MKKLLFFSKINIVVNIWNHLISSKYTPLLFLIFISLLYGYLNTINRDAINSFGWSPVGYTYGVEDAAYRPSNDYAKIAKVEGFLGNSLAMRIYPFLYNFEIEPSDTQFFFIIFSTLFYSLSLYFFIKTLLNSSEVKTREYFLVFAAFFPVFTPVLNGDFARFGQANLSLGQMYSVAIPLQLLAVTFVIKKFPIISGLCLAFLAAVHISLGVMTSAFVCVMYFHDFRVWKSWKSYFLPLLPVLSGIFWGVFVCNMLSGESYCRMAVKEWFVWENMQNYHFFPFDKFLLIDIVIKGVFPLIILVLLGVKSSFWKMLDENIKKSLFYGIGAISVLTILGFIFSVIPVNAQLTMLALHRSSGMLLFIFYVPAILFTYEIMEKKEWGWSILAMCLLFTAASNQYFAFILYAFILFMFSRFGVYVWNKAMEKMPTGNQYFELFFHKHCSYTAMLMTAFYIILFVYLSFCLARKLNKTSECYLDAQLWANANTPKNALFLPDLTKSYGLSWSEYSRRANWGALRDWLHTSLCYTNNKNAFDEGCRRLALFGISADDLRKKNSKYGIIAADFMQKDFQNTLKQLPIEMWLKIARQEKIDYLVLNKKYFDLPLQKVYENKEYVIVVPELKNEKAK